MKNIRSFQEHKPEIGDAAFVDETALVIGDVVLGAEDYDNEVRFSGQTAVFMGIWPLPNANSVDVIRLMNLAHNQGKGAAVKKVGEDHKIKKCA